MRPRKITTRKDGVMTFSFPKCLEFRINDYLFVGLDPDGVLIAANDNVHGLLKEWEYVSSRIRVPRGMHIPVKYKSYFPTRYVLIDDCGDYFRLYPA